MKILHVVGARPNFMKIAPIMEEMAAENSAEYPDRFEQVLVHTGQHYDEAMSQVFFDDLGIPRPDIDLGVGSGSHAEQTARSKQRSNAGLRAGAAGTAARPGAGGGRRQFDAGLHAGGEQGILALLKFVG